MIYDCFSYWDEDLLLDLRLNILDNYVDYFVIVEGNKTWQNNPKKLRFEIDKFKKFKNKMLKNIPLGRVAKESDVATAVAFLAADSSEMITGTSLLVDGGWTAQ